MDNPSVRFRTRAFFGAGTRLPLVQVTWGRFDSQLTSAKCREIAGFLFSAAESAYSDAAMYRCGRHHDDRVELLRALAGLRPAQDVPDEPEPGEASDLTPRPQPDEGVGAWVNSVFGADPLVDCQLGGEHQLLRPEDARAMAMRLFEGAADAEQEGAAFYACQNCGIRDAGAVLLEIRRQRARVRDDAERHEAEET